MCSTKLKFKYFIFSVQILLVLTSNQDNLCFLSHGGSSETFTVNEGLPVNSVIGSIKVSLMLSAKPNAHHILNTKNCFEN